MTSSLKPPDQFQPNLIGSIHRPGKEILISSNQWAQKRAKMGHGLYLFLESMGHECSAK